MNEKNEKNLPIKQFLVKGPFEFRNLTRSSMIISLPARLNFILNCRGARLLDGHETVRFFDHTDD